MKSLNEIKALFENKDYGIRSDFINDYDFKDEFREYYLHFILKSKHVKDHLYLSDLIDLSSWMKFYDIKIRKRWFSYLFEKKHFIVKLAVLDYFKYSKEELLFGNYEQKLNTLLKGKLPSILRNQILLNLICLNSSSGNKYLSMLLESLSKTKDWRSIYRTLINLNEIGRLKKHKKLIINHIKGLLLTKNFGEDVEKLLS